MDYGLWGPSEASPDPTRGFPARQNRPTRMLKLHGEVNLTSGVLKHCMTRERKYSLGLVACLHGLRSALMAWCCFARVAVNISPQRGPPHRSVTSVYQRRHSISKQELHSYACTVFVRPLSCAKLERGVNTLKTRSPIC